MRKAWRVPVYVGALFGGVLLLVPFLGQHSPSAMTTAPDEETLYAEEVFLDNSIEGCAYQRVDDPRVQVLDCGDKYDGERVVVDHGRRTIYKFHVHLPIAPRPTPQRFPGYP